MPVPFRHVRVLSRLGRRPELALLDILVLAPAQGLDEPHDRHQRALGQFGQFARADPPRSGSLSWASLAAK